MKLPKGKKSKQVYYFLGSFVGALLLTWLLKEPEFTASQDYVLFLLFFSVGLWVTEAIPPFATAFLVMAYLVYALGNPYLNPAPEKIDRYVNTFSSNIIWLLLGGFFLAAAMTKTGVDKAILRFTLKMSGTRPRNITIAFMSTAMIFSMIMSSSATTSMMVAALMPLMKAAQRPGLIKALLLGIAMAASLGGMGTIIGISSNAVAVGLLEDNGINVSFLNWMVYGFPLSIVLTICTYFVLIWLYVAKDPAPLSLQFLENDEATGSALHRIIVVVVLIITVLLWLTGSLHHIPVATVAAIPIVVLTLTGIILVPDLKTISWDTLILIAGGLSLGEALESTKILAHYSEQIRSMQMNSTAVLLVLSYAAMLLGNVMSNAATCALMIPLGFAMLPGMEKESALAITLASSAGLLLPVSLPTTSIVYSTGFLKPEDFRRSGLLVGILGPLLAVLWVLLVGG